MKKNILLSGILLLSFSCAVAQDYHDDVVVLDSVKVMSFNIRFNNPNDSLDTSWDRRREPCARMMATVSSRRGGDAGTTQRDVATNL